MIGCGNMAGAMLRQWIASGALARENVFVVNRGDRDLPGDVPQGRDFPEGPLPDAVMLGMKPYQLDEIAQRFADRLSGVPLILSILAGVEEAQIARRFEAGAVVRAMPNLPVGIGKGVVGLYSASEDVALREGAQTLMTPLGLVEWVSEEALFDVVTALAGSGPGFVYRFIEALAEGGAALGLPGDQALRLATATVEGAGLLAAEDAAPPAGELADRVASPGGSTREGLNVLDEGDALKKLVAATLAAARRRNVEMAAEARERG